MPRLTVLRRHFWPPELYARLEAIAQEEGRAVDAVLEECVEAGLRQKNGARLLAAELAAAYDRHLAIATGTATGNDQEFVRWLESFWVATPAGERPRWQPGARSDWAGEGLTVDWYALNSEVWGCPRAGGGYYRIPVPAQFPPVTIGTERRPTDR